MKNAFLIKGLVLTLCLLLSACSNDAQDANFNHPDPTPDSDPEEAFHQDDINESISNYPENWRSGRLLVSLKISQNGDQITETTAQGGTKTTAKWDYLLRANLSSAVMLPDDFSKLLPDYNAETLDARLFEEVLYLPANDHQTVITGEVTYSGFMEVRKPRANDVTLQLEEVSAHAPLTEFSLGEINPSSSGKGFETQVHLEYKMAGSIRSKMMLSGGSVVQDETDCCETEYQAHSFYPEPDLILAQKVVYTEDAGLPPEIQEINRQQRLDKVRELQRVNANQSPRAFLHPGMSWKIEPKALTLRYHSESPNLISQGDILAMAAPAGQRLFTLEITLIAD